MSKIKKKINRKASRIWHHRNRVRVGCALLALSLIALNPGIGRVYADADADAAKKTEKTVSENKLKSDKKKGAQDKSDESDSKNKSDAQQPVADGKPDVSQEPTAQPTQEAPEEKGVKEDVSPAEDTDEKTDQTPGDDADAAAKVEGVDEDSQGPEKDGESEGASGEGTEESPDKSTAGGSEAGVQTEGAGQGGPTDVPQQKDESAQSPAGEGAGADQEPEAPEGGAGEAPEYVQEQVEPVPVVGVVEGASTIIVGGLAPTVPEGDQGQEPVNKEAEVEGEENQEPQSRIAGSTPLVGGVIAGETPAGGSSAGDAKDKTVASAPRPTATPTVTRTPSTVTPAPTTVASQQGNTVALDDSAGSPVGQSTGGAQTYSDGAQQTPGQRLAGVLTEDSTKILPFAVVGVAALAAIVALLVIKKRRAKKDASDDQE